MPPPLAFHHLLETQTKANILLCIHIDWDQIVDTNKVFFFSIVSFMQSVLYQRFYALHPLCKLPTADLMLEEELLMEVGEVTENKKAAIMATLHRHSSRLCEGVSITCLVAILYSNNVTDSPVFSGLSRAPHKPEYLMQEILTTVEEDPAKFEAVCSSIALAHSPAYGHLLWSECRFRIVGLSVHCLLSIDDYERELAAYESGNTFSRSRLVVCVYRYEIMFAINQWSGDAPYQF